jgi:hypothetical protein
MDTGTRRETIIHDPARQAIENENVATHRTLENGRIRANPGDGRRILVLETTPEFAGLVDVLNAAPDIAARLLAARRAPMIVPVGGPLARSVNGV